MRAILLLLALASVLPEHLPHVFMRANQVGLAAGIAGAIASVSIGSFVIGLIYTFGQVLFPDLAYIILFLPMVVILAIRPRGLFGRISA